MLQFPCFQINPEIIDREQIARLQQKEIELVRMLFALGQNVVLPRINIPPDFEQPAPDGKLVFQQREFIAAFSFQKVGDNQFFSPDSFLQQPHCLHPIHQRSLLIYMIFLHHDLVALVFSAVDHNRVPFADLIQKIQ